MVRVDTGREAETWDERIRGAACVVDPNLS
jgi:hypothetical protein